MKIKEIVFGPARNVRDPNLFHQISLIAFLAWVGLGADGLSSSAYGPDEAYRAILQHPHIAVLLAFATTGTVLLISLAYSRLIEHFPAGGGGYVVATKLLSPACGVVSGCALLVDYILTITTSMAAAVDQIYSFIPPSYAGLKVPIECILIALLVLINLRGAKESVGIVVPIFVLFVITHAAVLIGCLVVYGKSIGPTAAHVVSGFQQDYHHLGLWAIFLLFINAYSRGAGTYTGIEAVSNGVPIMREPKIRTAKRTMVYMATSLAVTAGGILLCYLLVNVHAEEGKTLNAVLVESLGFGKWFVVLTLVAEGGLLMVAAQTGFLDGPRVMANMAVDGWLPHRFSALSERLTTHYGVILIGAAAIASLFYTHGDVTALVTMYSINVFVTFSLSQIGMCRFWYNARRENKLWPRRFALHFSALLLCLLILAMVVAEKFTEGGWITLVVTSALIAGCFLIRRHYRMVRARVADLSSILENLPVREKSFQVEELKTKAETAVLLVASYSGLGVHSLLSVLKTFPGHFKQFVFVSVGVLDSGNFKGEAEIQALENQVQADLQKYVALSKSLGFPATFRHTIGTDPVACAEAVCIETATEYSRAVFFGGKLVFSRDNWITRVLHNETAFAIQRRLQLRSLAMVVLPIRVAV